MARVGYGRRSKARAPSSDYIYTSNNIHVFGQMVILLDDEGKFVNMWHVGNLMKTKPGTLDVWKR